MKSVYCLILGAVFCHAQDAMEILRRAEDTYRGLRSLKVDVTCCNDHLAFFDLLARQFGGAKFVVIGVTGSDLDTAQDYLKQRGLKLETIHESASALRTALQLPSVPSLALIAADGTLAYGGYAGTPDELRARLAKLGVWP